MNNDDLINIEKSLEATGVFSGLQIQAILLVTGGLIPRKSISRQDRLKEIIKDYRRNAALAIKQLSNQ